MRRAMHAADGAEPARATGPARPGRGGVGWASAVTGWSGPSAHSRVAWGPRAKEAGHGLGQLPDPWVAPNHRLALAGPVRLADRGGGRRAVAGHRGADAGSEEDP